MVATKPPPREVEGNSSLITRGLANNPDAIRHADACAWYDIKPPTLTRWIQEDAVRVYQRIGTTRVVVSHRDVLENLHRLPDRLISIPDAARRYDIPYPTLQRRIDSGHLMLKIESAALGYQKNVRLIHEREVRKYVLGKIEKGKSVGVSPETIFLSRRQQRSHTKPFCTSCESNEKLRKNRNTGDLLCGTCTRRQRTPKLEKCTDCGLNRIVTQRLQDGQPLCQTCYRHKNPGKSQPKRGMCTRCSKGPQLISYLRPGTHRNICKSCRDELRSRLPMALQG